MMNFEYNTYKSNTFVFPLIFLVTAILLVIITYIVNLPKIKESKKNIPILVTSLILGLIVGGLIITIISIQLSYGVRLVKYGEKDPVYISGEIQEITEVPFSPKYRYNNEHYNHASLIKINDEKYYIMAIGNFKVGDTVQIKYLNKSNFVLSIDYFNRESETNIETDILIE